MKNKKQIIFVILVFLLSIILSLGVELLYFNKEVVTTNKKEQAKILNTENIEENNNEFLTTENSSITISIPDKVHKLQFEYETEENFEWKVEYKAEDNTEVELMEDSSNLINQAVRKLDAKTKEVKITFLTDNVKIKNIEINNEIYINWNRVIVFVVAITLFSILIIYRKYFYKRLDKAFLLIAIPVGILFILVLPKTVYTSWDDQIHIKNAYTAFSSEQTTFSQGLQKLQAKDELDQKYFQTTEERLALYDEINELHKETKDRVIQLNNYSPKYNRLVYLPFYVGFKIADAINLNLTTGIVLAKILNLLCYIGLIYAAIKVSTYAKKLVFAVGLTGSNLFLSSQFSYDPTIIASIILALAIFLRQLELEKINNKYIFIFILCIIWASLPKAIYCPLLLLLWFIPNKKFANKKQAIAVKVLAIIIAIILATTFILPFFLGSVAGDSRGGNTNASAQLSLIIHNPIAYAILQTKFFVTDGPRLLLGINTFQGVAYIESMLEPLTQILYLISLVFILKVTFQTPLDKKVITTKIKIAFLLALITLWLLITSAMYLSFTEVGNTTIEGVQARYFIPILLPLLLLLCKTEKEKKEDKNDKDLALLLVPLIILIAMVIMFVYKGCGV